jgi:hypothetical protein
MKPATLLAAAMAFSLAATCGAAAASKRKHKRMPHVAPLAAAPLAPYGARTPGPVWAMPNECYTDEGYGRYTPCGAGKDD